MSAKKIPDHEKLRRLRALVRDWQSESEWFDTDAWSDSERPDVFRGVYVNVLYDLAVVRNYCAAT